MYSTILLYIILASNELKNDKKVVLKGVKQNKLSFEYANKNLHNVKALEYDSIELQNDKEFILEYTSICI